MPRPRPALVTIKGELIKFIIRGEDGWGVGALDTGEELVDFTGKTLGAKPGAAIELSGQWVEHPRFGRQFKSQTCVIGTPVTSDGVVAWLASTLPDVGATRAQAMIDHFGSVDSLWQVIEHEHGRLCEVNGITEARAFAIHTAYVANLETRDAMVALRGWGLTDKQIQRCLDEWTTLSAVVSHIRNDPYQLAACVHGFGFLRADEVAQAMGIKPSDPRRIEAGLVHTLRVASHDGHVWLWGGQLQKMAAELLKVGADDVGRCIRRASAHRLIVRRGKRIYSAALESLEWKCATGISKLIGGGAAHDVRSQTIH